MNPETQFSIKDLTIDCDMEIRRIASALQDEVLKRFRKSGLVVGLSGGIDSSVVAALCVRAVGKEKVLGLIMPEKESSPDSVRFGELIAGFLGVGTIQIDITNVLKAIGCYQIRDTAIRKLMPEYTADYRCKIVLPNILKSNTYRIYSVAIESPDGKQQVKRLSKQAYLDVISASNFKQRVRKMFEYYHADRLNYAVAGTPNRLEYDQGFFVKLGDGAADAKPIAHLYKTQVCQLAEYLGVPREIRERVPTTDTYSMSQSQEEFFFSLPFEKTDLCLYGKHHDVPIEEVAVAAGLTRDQVERVYRDIDSKRRAAKYLHAAAVLVEGEPGRPVRRLAPG